MVAAVQTMAYAGEVPWHGLGNQIDPNQPLDVWPEMAGFTWEALKAQVIYQTEKGDSYYMPNRYVLYRSDNDYPLGQVSGQYEPVQPREVLEFFRDLTELGGGFSMETAGVLFNGERLWALARHTGELNLPGKDIVRPYLLLATSMDGTLATRASFTTVRVVCNNTLQLAINKQGQDVVRVTHRSKFDERQVKEQLGLIDNQFEEFSKIAVDLAGTKASIRAEEFYSQVFHEEYMELEPKEKQEVERSQQVQQVTQLYLTAPGQDTASANGTLWGLVNGMTYYLDHARNTRSVDGRLQYAWFGKGKDLKQRAMNLAQGMI